MLAFATSGCLDDGVPDLRTGPMSVGLAELAPTATGSEVPLDRCPVDDVAGVIDDTLDLVDDDVIRSALDDDVTTLSTASDGTVTVTCALVGTEGTASIQMTTAPLELDDHVRSLEERVGVPFEVDESRRYRGGRFQRICTAPPADADGSAPERCDVAWVDDLVVVSVSVTGVGATGVLLDDVEEQWTYLLPVVVDRFDP